MIKRVNFKNNLILYFFLFVLFSVFLSSSNAEAKIARLVINQIEYEKLIQKYFPGYILMNIEELEPFARFYFERDHPNLNPALVCKDFDGNEFLDYALLIRTSKIKDGNTVFAIFLQSEHEKFKLEFYVKMEFYLDFVYIVPIEAGKTVSQTEALDAPMKKVKLKNPAVHLIYSEKSSVAYYWDDKAKKFDSIWTSD